MLYINFVLILLLFVADISTIFNDCIENIMFCNSKRDSELRLIDFGSGTIDNATNPLEQDVDEHHTFAGSAFYISPEMFQR